MMGRQGRGPDAGCWNSWTGVVPPVSDSPRLPRLEWKLQMESEGSALHFFFFRLGVKARCQGNQRQSLAPALRLHRGQLPEPPRPATNTLLPPCGSELQLHVFFESLFKVISVLEQKTSQGLSDGSSEIKTAWQAACFSLRGGRESGRAAKYVSDTLE